MSNTSLPVLLIARDAHLLLSLGCSSQLLLVDEVANKTMPRRLVLAR